MEKKSWYKNKNLYILKSKIREYPLEKKALYVSKEYKFSYLISTQCPTEFFVRSLHKSNLQSLQRFVRLILILISEHFTAASLFARIYLLYVRN